MSINPFAEPEEDLPYNYLAERMVLAAILTKPESLIMVSQRLNVESFYLQVHKILYKAFLDMEDANLPIDYVHLITWLQDHDLLDEFEDISTISSLLSDSIYAQNVEGYIELIYDKYLRRLMIDLGYELIDYGFSTAQTFDQILCSVEERIDLIHKKRDKRVLTDSTDVLQQILAEVRGRLKENTAPSLGLLSGFNNIDRITGGFKKSDLIILASRPSMGKTALALNMATTICERHRVGVVFFSLEMSTHQLYYRLLSKDLHIPHIRLKSSRVTRSEWIGLNKSVRFFTDSSFRIDDTSNISITEIRYRLKKAKQELKWDLGFVVIDYLQLIEDPYGGENRVQEISKITRSLKQLAREFEVPILVLSQLSRNVESRPNKRPILSDLRDSGSIEQDADVVMMLYRDQYYNSSSSEKNIIEVNITKHRNGSLGMGKLIFEPSYLQFRDLKD